MEKTTVENNQISTNDIALEYMAQKYGEKFEYLAPWGNSMSGTREFLVKCGSLQGQEILVQIDNYKNDDRVVCDNYLAVKYRMDLISFIRNCASKVFGDAIVFYDVAKSGLSPSLPATATFEEYLADSKGSISAYIGVKSSSFLSKEQLQKMTEQIVTTCKADYLSLITVIVDDDIYGTLDSPTIKEKVVLRDFINCARLTREGGTMQVEWLGED